MSNFLASPPTTALPFASTASSHDGGISSPSLGNNNNVAIPYASQGPPYQPNLTFNNRPDTVLPVPSNGFAHQQPDPRPPSEPPLAAMLSSGPEYHHAAEDFHPYNPAQKPESRSSRGPPRHLTPTQSPDGRQSSGGRKRARTKVVAWDPKDLEEIYTRLPDPDQGRYATTSHHKKQREAMGSNYKNGKGSTYSDSPQPGPNGIKWASVNGYQSSPADLDRYRHRPSVDDDEDDETSDEFDLSSGPDSDHGERPSRQPDHPARSTPLQAHDQPATDSVPEPSGHPAIPIAVQEVPQGNGQVSTAFDVLAAQSRGKAIAPRQPPPFSSTRGMFDDRNPLPQPPPPPELRSARGKRGRDSEVIDPDSRAPPSFGKRRRQQAEPIESTISFDNSGEGYMTSFNPAPAFTSNPQPLQIPQDSDLDELCIHFRDAFRIMKAKYEEEHGAQKVLYEASLGRANARATLALQKLDEHSQYFADQVKENQLSSQIECDLLDKKVEASQSENRKFREDIAHYQSQIAALNGELEHERGNQASKEASHPPSGSAHSPSNALQQELSVARQNAKRADTANNLLDEEITRMRLANSQFQERIQAAKTYHARLTATLDEFVSQDLEDMTHKAIKEHVLTVKRANDEVSEKLRHAVEALADAGYLMFEPVQQIAR
ncbi:MAG: hypothetical protein Q9220_000192 [cf. Caloplaca sp. 1 TL-2023]